MGLYQCRGSSPLLAISKFLETTQEPFLRYYTRPAKVVYVVPVVKVKNLVIVAEVMLHGLK